jgi:hydrogenase maturation factor HypF (carbamoyltransferase family)
MTTLVEEGDLLLHVTGILPVADFHPFVVRLARRLGVRGWIRHEAAGAVIRAIGTEDKLYQLVRAIRVEAPPSLRVRGMEPLLVTADTPAVGDGFTAITEELAIQAPSSEHPGATVCVA